jgi:hypothetical protein
MPEYPARVVILSLVLGLAFLYAAPAALAKPFELGVEQKEVMPGQNPYEGQAEYPVPQAIQPYQGGIRDQAPIQGGTGMQGGRPPMEAGIQRSIPLPPQFLGTWLVKGQRQGFEAQPQFQAAIPQIFAGSTKNVWTISGNPSQGYAFSNEEGARSPLFVNKVQGNTAFIRYGHPIKNTMAQEAIVMELSPDGKRFKGLERITIVKQGEPPRAKVTYQLVGQRRR